MQPAMTDDATGYDFYLIPSLKLDKGWFLFSSVSKFLSSITPNDVPLVHCILELLRDAFQSKVSILQIIIEALKVESGYICLIGVIFLLSIFPLCYTVCWYCSKNKLQKHTVSDMVEQTTRIVTGAEAMMREDLNTKLYKLNSRKKAFVFILQSIIALLLLSIISMFIINEQISMSINDTPTVLKSALKDAEMFVKNSDNQIQFELFEEFDKTQDKIKIDLEDIHVLLGDGIIREISVHHNLDVSFESIMNIIATSKNLSLRVQNIMNDLSVRILQLSADAAIKVDEIHTQLSVLQSQCNYRDRPLCDTLKIKSFEEMGIIRKLKMLNNDHVLLNLKNMDDEMKLSNFNKLSQELQKTKKIFRNYSVQLQQDTLKESEEILKQLTVMRNGFNVTSLKLKSVTKKVVNEIEKVWNKLQPLLLGNLKEAEYINWFIGVVACTSALIVTMFLLAPLTCTCYSLDLAGTTFAMAACIISTFSIFLGLFTIFEVILGGHGEAFVCRAFYESPDYTIIGKLFDKPGIVYPELSEKGVFSELLLPPEPDAIPFTNTSLSKVLGDCECSKSTYVTFHIDNLLDLTNKLGYEKYMELKSSFNAIAAMEFPFISLTTNIQSILLEMSNDEITNFTSYRMELSNISPEKELTSFIDQMQRVSLQIQDSSTASRMKTLGSSARRIQSNMLVPLEFLKTEIVFQLTALELKIVPWKEKISDVKENLKALQAFLDAKSGNICGNLSENYRKRLKSSLDTFKIEMLENINENMSCRPLFDIFHGIRLLFCGHIVENISGLFFLSFLVLFLWILSTPVSLLLASTFKEIEEIQQQLKHTTNSYEGVMVNEENSGSWSRRSHYQPEVEIDRSNWSSREEAIVLEIDGVRVIDGRYE